MASFRPRFLLLITSLFVFIFSLSFAAADQKSFRPRALVLPVTKDANSGQYVTTLKQRTPLVPVKLTVDVGGRFMWVDCDTNYVSSTYRTPLCSSAQCSLANRYACGGCIGEPRPGCHNNSCTILPQNVYNLVTMIGELTEDVVSVSSTDGSNPGRAVSVPRFLFSCAPSSLSINLANGVTGMAGLGRTRVGMPSLFASAFSFRRKFALCLPSDSSSTGALFFGDSPYKFLPGGIDAASLLSFTPLILNPVSFAAVPKPGEASAEYYIGVKSIRVNGKTVPAVNSTLLKLNKEGNGGTRISTADSVFYSTYTTLQTSIYDAVLAAFVLEAKSMNIIEVPAASPFGACFSTKSLRSTRVGPAVPTIDLVMHTRKVYWRIFGANSIVDLGDDISCLGFVDGGVNARNAILINGYQLEDNLLQFDLASSSLGFTSSLRFRHTTCSNFNFTSNA
ncbi:hypothetical protein H6P81_002483 [Aristolochia fimbriata]|uniref:Peptidase A1 domain-containing protein n=1 Tax=Aristolochia fimbriata TaxID=158543 RepID=A0AAV7FCR8_ARIFI|nr:hypothetical protein H6P81_002483 [Aristolochia fimbriata]